jgi:hypothetical protein
MNAIEAAKQAAAAREAQRQARLDEAEAERQRRDEISLKNHDLWMKATRVRIAEAVKDGRMSMTMDGADSRILDALRKEGYKTETISGSTNMGDSSAPCMVDYTITTVSW